MSFAFPGGHAPRTPDAALYRVANVAPLRTPDAAPYHAAPTRTPGAAPYRAADQVPIHPHAPLLVAPRSNDSNHLVPFRRPSFSSITQPVVHSPSAYKSRTVSSTARVQHQAISAVPAPVLPPRVGGSGTAPSRSRTVSSGPSMRPPVQYTNLTPSLPVMAGHQSDPALARVGHQSKPSHTAGSRTHHHQVVHQHSQQPPIHPSSSAPQQHPMLMDICLVNAVTVAGRDETEFRWYPVWVIAIKDWMFANASTATVACNLAPQYTLEYTPKPDKPSPGTTPGSVAKPKKTWVIPDFAQVLQYVQTSNNGSRIHDIQKVILLVENKPKLRRQAILSRESPFVECSFQIRTQALYAFMGDPSLHMIGVILAFGARWRYIEIDRPRDAILHSWMEVGDKTYGPRKDLPQVVPDELQRLSIMPDWSFELLDHTGRSARAFDIIVRRIKSREKEMWNL